MIARNQSEEVRPGHEAVTSIAALPRAAANGELASSIVGLADTLIPIQVTWDGRRQACVCDTRKGMGSGRVWDGDV